MVLVTAKEAAAWTGKAPGTIWRWASEGRITSHGGRYDLDELPHKSTGRIPEQPKQPHTRPGSHQALADDCGSSSGDGNGFRPASPTCLTPTARSR